MKIHSIIRSLAPVFFVLTLTALYHPLDAQKNQTTASAGAKEKRSAPAVKTPAKKAAPAVPAAPAVLRQGLEHLKSRNFSEARSAFKTAQKGASKDVKKQCRALKQVGRKYHKKYFRALNKCLQLQKSGDYKAGILAYNKAESKFRAINRRSVAALLKPVDDHLMKQHAADVKRLNEQRIAAYTKAISDAKRDMKTSPRNARNRLDYAKTQMNPTDVSATKVDELITDANYNIALQDGNNFAAQGQLESALACYYTASLHRNTAEIQGKISSTRTQLYTKCIVSGDYNASAGNYESAAKNYARARQLTDNTAEVDARMFKQHDKLFAYGNSSFELGKYADAVRWYDLAGLFASSQALTEARTRANNYLQHKIYMDKASTELAAGNAYAACDAVNAAVKYRTTDESEALRRKLDAYVANMKTARTRLNEGNAAQALQAVQTAQTYVPQGVEAKNMTTSINTYSQKVDAARAALRKGDRVAARVSLGEAQKIADTREVRDLSAEANKQ